jgi:hypothetical protein
MKHDMTLERTIELERFDSTGASGFVNRQDGDESVVVRLVSGKEILGETRAELFRPDLVARNVSAHPYCGFVLPVPLEKVKSSFGKIDVVRADGILIARGDAEQKSAINLQGIGAEEILTLCGDIFCGVNHFAIEVGVLSVWGLVLPPRGRYGDLECVGQDGVSFKFHWPIHSPGSEDFYWYFPGAPYLGFRIDIDLARSADPSSRLARRAETNSRPRRRVDPDHQRLRCSCLRQQVARPAVPRFLAESRIPRIRPCVQI